MKASGSAGRNTVNDEHRAVGGGGHPRICQDTERIGARSLTTICSSTFSAKEVGEPSTAQMSRHTRWSASSSSRGNTQPISAPIHLPPDLLRTKRKNRIAWRTHRTVSARRGSRAEVRLRPGNLQTVSLEPIYPAPRRWAGDFRIQWRRRSSRIVAEMRKPLNVRPPSYFELATFMLPRHCALPPSHPIIGNLGMAS